MAQEKCTKIYVRVLSTQLFDGCCREPFGCVKNDPLDHTVPRAAARTVPVGPCLLLKTDIDARGHPSTVLTECTQGASDRRGMDNGPGACPGGRHVCIGGSTRPPGGQQPCGDIPVGMA